METSQRYQNGEKFSVPKNSYIIGTMNTADKSIALFLDTPYIAKVLYFKDMYPSGRNWWTIPPPYNAFKASPIKK